MGKKDPRVDAYIAKSADFARPILIYLRAVVHEGCPEVVEGIKWGVPAYLHHGTLCMTAGFKAHCRLVFWKGKAVVGEGDGARQFGMITKVADLPPKKTLVAYVKAAALLNESPTAKGAKRKSKKIAAHRTPAVLSKALAENKKAKATFDAFAMSHRKEYIEWITDAKTEDTRDRRIKQAVKWMAEGKPWNWKYMKAY